MDTQKCGTHTQALIEESGKQILYGVRLKVDKEKISEIEAIVVRGKEVLDVKAILDTKDQDWEGIFQREDFASVAGDYLLGQQKDGHDPCHRPPWLA